MPFRFRNRLVIVLLVAMLGACSSVPPPTSTATPGATGVETLRTGREYFSLDDHQQSQEMVIFALGLLDTGYRFGGRNPEAGLDCSGMVSYIVEQISGRRLPSPRPSRKAKPTRSQGPVCCRRSPTATCSAMPGCRR